MANATVWIAIGAASPDVALEAADVALMSDDLSQLPFAVGLSRSTRRVINQKLVHYAQLKPGIKRRRPAGRPQVRCTANSMRCPNELNRE
jgi:hypothetical protein